MGIPRPEACLALLTAQRVPDHIRRHSEQVARLVKSLAEELRACAGEPVDVELAVAGALLHDIAKAACFDGRRDHAQEGAKMLCQLGWPELGALVERHVELGVWDPQGAVTEAELLNYCDKRVRHEEVVSLAERFADLQERYGGLNEEAAARIRANLRTMETLERKIFGRLPFGPEQLGAGGMPPEGEK